MKSAEFYKERHHPQYRLSEANIRLYNLILDLDVNTIFEFGCGIGRHLHRLGEFGYKCTGVDISPKCVKEARKSGLNVRIANESKLHRYKEYDLVFTNSVLCHMEDVTEALEQLKRMAKKYLVLVECVNKNNDHWYIHDYGIKELMTIPPHLTKGAEYKIFVYEF